MPLEKERPSPIPPRAAKVALETSAPLRSPSGRPSSESSYEDSDERYTSLAMDWRERVIVDPLVLVGKPIVKGTRLSVQFIVDLLAQGWSEQDVLANYPGLGLDDIRACLAYASAVLSVEKVYPLSA